jgi:hypothetical protein
LDYPVLFPPRPLVPEAHNADARSVEQAEREHEYADKD